MKLGDKNQKKTASKKTENSNSHNCHDREKKFEQMVAKAEETCKTSAERLKEIEDQVVAELNKKHAIVHTDQFYVLTEKSHSLFDGIDFTLESKQSFVNTYENQIPAGHTKSKARIWLTHINRRQYDGITFDPTTTKHKNGLYNIWKGFAVTPKKGDCVLFKNHVENVICAGNKEYFRYIWKWMAHLIQKPNEIATGIVIMGSQGTGKGKFAKTLGKLFGHHFLHLDNLDRLLGNFNFHMKNAVLVFGDEAIWGGNKKDIGKLKAMVTEEFAMIEPKGKDAIPVRNFRHFILSSNDEWPIHIDPDDRRFLVIKVSSAHKEDFSYFKAIDLELEKGGFEALLYDLMHEDISGFNPRELPQNAEAFDVKMKSATSDISYIYQVLYDGCFDIGNVNPAMPWKEVISVDSVYADYKCWCSKQNKTILSSEILGKSLRKFIPSVEKIRPREGEVRVQTYKFPLLEKARREFEKSFKAGTEIWE